MALLEVVDSTRDGFDAAGGDAADTNGDRFVNTGKEALFVTNASGSPVNVTMKTVDVDGMASAGNVVSCPDSKTTVIGCFPLGDYSDEVEITYADATSLTVQVVRFRPGV